MSLAMEANAEEFKTISEVSKHLDIPQHVLRFWEGQFAQIKPVKRRGGRRFYSPRDVEIIEKIKVLLYTRGYTIKGAKMALNQHFIPFNEPEMRKKDSQQTDIFEMIEKPVAEEKNALKKILENLKYVQKLLQENDPVK